MARFIRETTVGRHISREATDTWLASLHRCMECGDPIEDDYYYRFGADYFCPECVERHKRRNERS